MTIEKVGGEVFLNLDNADSSDVLRIMAESENSGPKAYVFRYHPAIDLMRAQWILVDGSVTDELKQIGDKFAASMYGRSNPQRPQARYILNCEDPATILYDCQVVVWVGIYRLSEQVELGRTMVEPNVQAFELT